MLAGLLSAIALSAACDTNVPVAGKPCAGDADCADPAGTFYCAPTAPPVCLPGVAVPALENRPPVVQSTTVVAKSGEEVVARISAIDPEGDTDLSYRLVLDSGATGIVVLLDPATDNVEPGTFRFRATSEVSGPFLNQPFDVIVTDSQGAAGNGAIYTVVVNADAVKSFTGIEDSSLEEAANFDPSGVPTRDDAVLLPPLTPNAPTEAGSVEVGSLFIGNDVTHDLTGAGIFGASVFSASAGTGTVRLEQNPDIAGNFPTLRFVRGGRLLGATAATEVFIASAPEGETAPSIVLGLNTLSTQRDVLQTPRGAGFQMAKSPDRDLLPVLFVGRDLRLDGGRNDFQSGDVYVGRSLFITGTSFQPGQGMTLTFTGVSGPGEVRLASIGQSHLPTTNIRPEATVTFQSSLRIEGDLDVDGVLSVFSGNTVDVEGTLRLRRNFIQGEGPFGQLRANQCDVSPFVNVPTWITCLGIEPPADAGSEPEPEPEPEEPEPPLDSGTLDGGDADGGDRFDGGVDGGFEVDAGGPQDSDSGVLDAGFVDDGGTADAGAPPNDGGPSAIPLPSCPQKPTLPPAPVHNTIVHRVGSPGGVVLLLDDVHNLLPPGDFESFSSDLGAGGATGSVTVENGAVFLSPPEVPTQTSFYVRYLDEGGTPVAGVCIDLFALDGEDFFVLHGPAWESPGNWTPTSPVSDTVPVLVDHDGTSLTPSDYQEWGGPIYISHRSGLSIQNQGSAPTFGANGEVISSGTVQNTLTVWSGSVRGRFSGIDCDGDITATGNVIAASIIETSYGSLACGLDLGPHSVVVAGDVSLYNGISMQFPQSRLYVGGNLNAFWMGNVGAVAGEILFAGNVSLFGMDSGTIIATLTAVGTGNQDIAVDDTYDINLQGSGTANFTQPTSVANRIFIDQPLMIGPGASITASRVVFGPGFPYFGGDSVLQQVSASTCDDTAWVAANGGAGGPCDEVGQ